MRDDNGYFRRFNQSLYFSRLQTDMAEMLGKEEGEGFSVQQLQCYCEASVECLYRALYFLSCSLIQEHDRHTLQSSPTLLKTVLDKVLNEQPSAVLQELVSALNPHLGVDTVTSSYDLAGLITAYDALWQAQKQTIQARASLLAVREIHITAEQCREWHKQISAIGHSLVENSAEY